MRFLTVLLLLAPASCLFAQTSDYPGASDMPGITRPAGSFLIGAMRIDNDEYAIPTGPVERNVKTPAKSISITGSIDTIAYSGPTTTSSFSTYNGFATQLKAAGYTELWSCARATCGSAYTLASLLAQPTIDTIHQGDWGHYMINSLYAPNDDSRYGAFRRGNEYVLVLASLSSGNRSGAMLIRIANPPAASLLQSLDTTAATQAAPATQPAQSLRNKARNWLNRVP